ncbi:MAG: hypothetical protein A3K66_00130 [Euryarchaeota archaeon RBG_16_67_27]|nr:MAG: hypothetical protein A3K66_00130 [Euryarchaeota archaeon RBG_16_67_27]
MTSGATAQIAFPGRSVEDLLGGYERALVEAGFEIRKRDWTGQYFVHKAVLGSKAKAYVVSKVVPFGSLMRAGKRVGAEAQIYLWGDQAVLRVVFVPYMELFDRSEIMFLSAGVFEKITDDQYCVDKLHEVLGRMAAMGYPVPRTA